MYNLLLRRFMRIGLVAWRNAIAVSLAVLLFVSPVLRAHAATLPIKHISPANQIDSIAVTEEGDESNTDGILNDALSQASDRNESMPSAIRPVPLDVSDLTNLHVMEQCGLTHVGSVVGGDDDTEALIGIILGLALLIWLISESNIGDSTEGD